MTCSTLVVAVLVLLAAAGSPAVASRFRKY